MPANIHGGWKTCGDPRSLADRFEEKLNELAVVAPSVCYGSPRTELTLVELTALIEKFRAAKQPAPTDRYFTAAVGNWRLACRQYHEVWLVLREQQRELDILRRYWDYGLLGSVTDDLFVHLPMVDGSDDGSKFRTEAEATEAGIEIQKAIDRMRERIRRATEILHYKVAPPEQKNRMLIEALWNRMRAVEQPKSKPKKVA